MEINVKVLVHHGQQSVLQVSSEQVEHQTFVRLVRKVLFHSIEELKTVLNVMYAQRDEFVMIMELTTSVFQLYASLDMYVEKELGKDLL